MSEYVIRVRQDPDGYRATVLEAQIGSQLDVRTLPTGAAGIGRAATAPAAVIQAVIAARLPQTPTNPRRPYAC